MGDRSSKANGGKYGGGFREIGEDVNDAITYFNKDGSLGEWRASTTNEEKDAVYNYTTSAFRKINDNLRAGNPPTDEDKILDSAISKFDLKEGITVTRGSSTDLLAPLGLSGTPEEMAKQINENHVGGVLIDKAYLSTSTSTESAFSGEVKYKIGVTPGKGKGAFIGEVSEYRSESEFLFARGAKQRITGAGVEDNGYGHNRLVVYLRY